MRFAHASRAWLILSCAVVLVAIGVIAPGAASAAEPEFLECATAKGKTGGYTDKLCSEVNGTHKGGFELQAVTHKCAKAKKVGGLFTGAFEDNECTILDPTHEGEFEFKPGVAKDKPFTGSIEAAHSFRFVFKGAELPQIECLAGSDEGLVTGAASLGEVVFSFKNCKDFVGGGGNCTTPGLLAGDITTSSLEGPVGGPAAVALHAAAGVPIAEFQCNGFPATRLTGTLLLSIGGDINQVEAGLELAESGLTGLEGGPPTPLQFEVQGLGGWIGPGEAELLSGSTSIQKGELLELKV